MVKDALNLYSSQINKKGKRKVHEEIIMLDIMEQKGWSYDEYMNTPAYLIEIIIGKNEIDYKYNKLKNGNK